MGPAYFEDREHWLRLLGPTLASKSKRRRKSSDDWQSGKTHLKEEADMAVDTGAPAATKGKARASDLGAALHLERSQRASDCCR